MLEINRDGEALIEYLDAEFFIIKPGAYVTCAVTGKRIALDALKYWNVDEQEPYVDAHAAMIGFGLLQAKGNAS